MTDQVTVTLAAHVPRVNNSSAVYVLTNRKRTIVEKAVGLETTLSPDIVMCSTH